MLPLFERQIGELQLFTSNANIFMKTGESCEAAVLLLSPEFNLRFQDFTTTEEDMILFSNPVLSLHVEGVRGVGCSLELTEMRRDYTV